MFSRILRFYSSDASGGSNSDATPQDGAAGASGSPTQIPSFGEGLLETVWGAPPAPPAIESADASKPMTTGDFAAYTERQRAYQRAIDMRRGLSGELASPVNIDVGQAKITLAFGSREEAAGFLQTSQRVLSGGITAADIRMIHDGRRIAALAYQEGVKAGQKQGVRIPAESAGGTGAGGAGSGAAGSGGSGAGGGSSAGRRQDPMVDSNGEKIRPSRSGVPSVREMVMASDPELYKKINGAKP